ncbi:MAG: hypothetical protein LAO31_11450 [Acidobacteriia bacterium]|nr:hypothetical protein [Terriglobia bacterium]
MGRTVSSLCLLIALGNSVMYRGQETPRKNRSAESEGWTNAFTVDESKFQTSGRNPNFILQPGYQLILEGEDHGAKVRLTITVLRETKKIGNVQTRGVEEKETENGELIEVSKNYFAIYTPTNSVFYFGEDVDIYRSGRVVGHSGSWQAGVMRARFGLMMPGTIRVGEKYFQEIAPGIAMDRAEIISAQEAIKTPLGEFLGCIKVEETTPLEPKNKEYKFYAPGIGLVRDGSLWLTRYGFQKQ